MTRAGRLLIALAYLLTQAYSLGHEALEPHAAGCCPNDGLARLSCGDDCDVSDHHHHRPHARCAACVKALSSAPTLGHAVEAETITAERPLQVRPARVAAEPGPGAPRAPPVVA